MKHTGIRAALLPGVALMLWSAAGAHAGEGYLEINQDCAAVGCFPGDTSGAPVTIPASGRYRLTSDLTGGNTIQFGPAALDVDLDLGGFTLDGGGRCAGLPVTTCTGGSSQVAVNLPPLASGFYLAHIHDGTIRGFLGAISTSSLAGGSSFERLLVTENSNIAAACFLDNGEPNSTIYVRQSRFVRNRSDGLRPNTNGGAPLIRLVVEDSVFSGNGNLGLGVYSGSVVTGNTFTDNSGSGLSCSPNNAAPVGTAMGGNAFFGNRPSLANNEYSCAPRDMGGNVCQDGACP
jgi:hypothetical protein